VSAAVILVSRVRRAEGSVAAAAALACAAAEPEQAALLVELTEGRAPRPALVASVGARRMEERLVAHLREAPVAARGNLCHLALPADGQGLERLPAALAVAREGTAVVHLPPQLLSAALEAGAAPGAQAVALRADLDRDRALTGLAARELMSRGLAVTVLKRGLGWIPSRRAMFGVLPAGAGDGLPRRAIARCLGMPLEPQVG
jgi:hypothetical protein